MKRIKGMLAIIAILAVIGGTFAYKAKNAYCCQLIYTNTTAHTTFCNALAEGFTTTTGSPSALTEVYYTTFLTYTTCTATAFLKTDG
jgi:hypothetical protein